MPNINFAYSYKGIGQKVQYEPAHLGGDVIEYPVQIHEVNFSKLDKSWTRTPNYFSLVKKGIFRAKNLPMNDFAYFRQILAQPYGQQTMLTSTGNVNGVFTFRRTTYTGALLVEPQLIPDSIPGNVAPLTQIDFNLVDELAKNKTLLGLKDQKVNLWQAWAERGQTQSMMTKTIQRIVGSVTALKQGNFGAAARALGVKASPRRIRKYKKGWASNQSDAIARGWLELVYGWKPLLSDIYGTAETLAQKNVKEVRNRLVSSVTRVSETSGSLPDFHYGGRHVARSRMRYIVKYTVYYSTSEVNHTLAQIGLTNPALIAWELTPWSFVVDWFVPIGNYISTWDATNGLTFEKGCRTTFKEFTHNSIRYGGASANWPDLGSFKTIGSCTYSRKDITVSRTAISSFPPSQLPSFKNPLSATHFLNALALLKTTFGR